MALSIDSLRRTTINSTPTRQGAVLYIMGRDQRIDDNHALLEAQSLAISHNSPLYVAYIFDNQIHQSREHSLFALGGLRDVLMSLSSLNIPLILRNGDAKAEILRIAHETQASTIVFDFSPLTRARDLITNTAERSHCSVIVVDTHNVVPVLVASDKQEFAAHTIRRKIHHHLDSFLIAPQPLLVQKSPTLDIPSLSIEQVAKQLSKLPASGIRVATIPGQKASIEHTRRFIRDSLADYAHGRNDIAIDRQSGLSPYLHFGHISALRVALEVIDAVKSAPLLLHSPKLASSDATSSAENGMNALFEEMIVRKELADNFCYYKTSYLSLDSAPDWARKSLAMHASDERDFLYSYEQWLDANTHDPIWNAAQTELLTTGKMHGYMRMYWAKKILEWSESPEIALQTAIKLNDHYSIDGSDPNGYAGILWSIGGLHDRPWFERPVYGKIRYMNDSGLRRKYDVASYIARVNNRH
jgi:deoxyribodipyrimidine photo-lyase